MNSRFLSAALIFAGLGLAQTRADDPSTPPTPPPATPSTSPADGTDQAPPTHRHHHMRAAFVLGELTEKLGLTADQQKTVGGIIAGSDGQLKALRQDDSLSQQDKRAQAKTIIETTRGQIRAALTPAQQKIFDTLPRRGQGKGEGTPPPPPPTT